MELTANARYLDFQKTTNIGNKPLALQQPIENKALVEPTQVESFTPTVPLKVARPGSDMAQMMEDLQDNGFVPQQRTDTSEVVKPKPKLKEPTNSYMSEMVEAIRTEQGTGMGNLHVAMNSNGTISLLDDNTFGSGDENHDPSTHEHDEGLHAKDHAHGHGHKGDVLLGTHLGTEVMEQVGHQAHEVAGAVGAHATAELGSTTSHAVTHVVTAAQEGANTLTDVSDAVIPSAHGLKGAVELAKTTTEGGGEIAHHLSTGMEIGLGVASVASGALAVPLFIAGVKELKAGLKEGNKEKIAEGVGGLVVGTRSAAAGTVMAGMLSSSEIVGTIAHAAGSLLTPLGLVHAAIDTGIGISDIRKGKKTEGLLKIGMGLAVAATALGAGIPGTVAALTFLGAKVVYKLVHKSQEKKKLAATEEQTKQAQGQAKVTTNVDPAVKPTGEMPVVNGAGGLRQLERTKLEVKT